MKQFPIENEGERSAKFERLEEKETEMQRLEERVKRLTEDFKNTGVEADVREVQSQLSRYSPILHDMQQEIAQVETEISVKEQEKELEVKK